MRLKCLNYQNLEPVLKTSTNYKMLWWPSKLFSSLTVWNFHGGKIETSKVGEAERSKCQRSTANDFAGRSFYENSCKDFTRERILYSSAKDYSGSDKKQFLSLNLGCYHLIYLNYPLKACWNFRSSCFERGHRYGKEMEFLRLAGTF